ncbi:MAG TPA: response regulator [Clostridiales bacterium]|nr:response regulator [Clostridiales bacterium]
MIYRVYMVDDEPMALANYKAEIAWVENNFELVGMNTNPLKAIEEIDRLQPHVIFTDIMMPFINGLELIERLKEKHSKAEYILISAFDDYRYLRKSLQLDAFDYLLKPVTKNDYEALFIRIHQRLSEKFKEETIEPIVCSEKFNAILNYLNLNLQEKYSLSDISEKFNISSNTLCSYFNRYLNTTFVNYMIKIRMEYARKLLLQTSKSVKEIAVLSGYDDYFYFCRLFQRSYHSSPTALRKNAAGSKELL